MIFQYRKVVVEWMIDVCDYFNLHQTTTHAAVAYLDRLQPNEQFSRFEWQMLAICCILISCEPVLPSLIFIIINTFPIAAKYNESEENVPDLATLEEITQQKISNEAVLNYELWALKRMGWKLNGETNTMHWKVGIFEFLIFPFSSANTDGLLVILRLLRIVWS